VLDRLARVECRVLRPRGNAELLLGAFAVEPALAVVLDDGVADGGGAVVDRDGADLVAVSRERDVAGVDPVDPDRILRPAARRERDRFERRPRPRRAVDRERRRPLVEVERLEQPRQAEHVVAVAVGDEDVVDAETGPEPHHLALGAFPAVEQEPVPLEPEGDRAGVARRRGHGPARSQEGEPHRRRLGDRRRKECRNGTGSSVMNPARVLGP
jgi:hypothetical protein